MENGLYFSNLITKSLEPVSSEERFFEGYLTVEVKDKQGEITIVDELMKVLPVWMDRGAPISDTHSNRIIGKGINYARAVYKNDSGEEFPAIKITGKIHKNYELDREIWEKIKKGEYKGLSFGGATKSDRTPKVMKDGSVAYALKDLEHYEVAVCKDPAVPLAIITDFNPIAKSMAGNTEERDGKMVIKCSKFGCVVEKADKEVELTEGGKKVLDEAKRYAQLEMYKADLRGIETFEGKVEALMREGKPRANAERIVGSFTKKYEGDSEPEYHDESVIPEEDEPKKKKTKSRTYDTAKEEEEAYRKNHEDHYGQPCKGCVDGKPTKSALEKIHAKYLDKSEVYGTDYASHVSQAPDTPREMELEKDKKIKKFIELDEELERIIDKARLEEDGKDLSNTGGDTSSLYNQGGAGQQRPNSNKSEPNVQQGVAGGEVPPQWIGSGSPYPEERDDKKATVRRRNLIQSYKELKKSAFELDIAWSNIDLARDIHVSKDAPTDTVPKKQTGNIPKKDLKHEDYSEHPQHFRRDPERGTVEIYDRKLDPKDQYERTEHLGRLGQNFQAESTSARNRNTENVGLIRNERRAPNEMGREYGHDQYRDMREALEDATQREDKKTKDLKRKAIINLAEILKKKGTKRRDATGTRVPVGRDERVQSHAQYGAGEEGGQSHATQSTLARHGTGHDAGTAMVRGRSPRMSQRKPTTTTEEYADKRGVTGITDHQHLTPHQIYTLEEALTRKRHNNLTPHELDVLGYAMERVSHGGKNQKVRHNPKFSRGKNPTGKKTYTLLHPDGSITVRGQGRGRREDPLGDPKALKAMIELTEMIKGETKRYGEDNQGIKEHAPAPTQLLDEIIAEKERKEHNDELPKPTVDRNTKYFKQDGRSGRGANTYSDSNEPYTQRDINLEIERGQLPNMRTTRGGVEIRRSNKSKKNENSHR